MSGKLKKIITIILATMLLVCTCGLIACSDEDEPVNYTISLDKSAVELNLFEEVTLTASGEYDGVIVWSTSDSAIATVVDGKVKGVGVGDAVVTATVGEGENAVSANCNVKVAIKGDLELLVNYDKIQLDKGQSITLAAGIFVNQTDVGATYTFSTTDNAIIQTENVSNGRFYVKALEYGVATVNVKTTYLGVEYEQDIIITVKEDVSLVWNTSDIVINDGKYSLLIDRMNTSVSPAVKNSITLDLSVYKAGNEVEDANISWSIDKPEVLSLSENTVTVIGFGSATVTAKYVSSAGNEYVKELEITVDPGEIIEIAESKYVQKDAVFSINGNVIETAYDLYSVEKLFDSNGWKRNGEVEVYAESGVNFYKVKVNVVDLVISSETEFKQFHEELKTATTALYADKYVVLDADLDLAGYGGWYDLNQNENIGFAGCFDGRNYTIYGGNYGQGGIFKGITASGVVKNINVVAPTIKWGYSGVIAGTIAGTVENVNVIINGKQSTNDTKLSEAAAFAYKTTSTARFTKCSIYCFDLPTGVTYGTKTFGFAVVQSFKAVGTDPNCNVIYSQTVDNIWHDSKSYSRPFAIVTIDGQTTIESITIKKWSNSANAMADSTTKLSDLVTNGAKVALVNGLGVKVDAGTVQEGKVVLNSANISAETFGGYTFFIQIQNSTGDIFIPVVLA